MSTVEARLAAMGIALPSVQAPVANYVSARQSGRIFYLSGQLSIDAHGGIKGTIGLDRTVEDGVAAARLCGINLIAQMKAALDGDLDRVSAILRLGGYVRASPGFSEISAVMNGCSDLMVAAFGEQGRHARSAVGVSSLPFSFAVEADAIVEVSS